MRRLLVPILMALLVLATGSVLAQSAKADAPHPLPQREKILFGSVSKMKQNAAFILAKAFGEFEKENLDVEYTTQKSSDLIVLLSTGRLDASASQAGAAFFNAVAGGSEIKQVAPIGFFGPKNGIWVSRAWLKDRPWSPSLLKGQAVASTAGNGSVSAYVLQSELVKAGLTLQDITWRVMSFSDILVALENGAVNVGVMVDPLWLKVDPNKVVFAFPYTSDITGGYFFGPNLLVKKRAVGEAFIRAIVRTQRTYLQGDYGNNPRVVATLAKELELTEDQIRASAGSIRFPYDMTIRKDFAEIIQSTYLSTPGILTYATPLSDEAVMDRSFLRAAGAGR